MPLQHYVAAICSISAQLRLRFILATFGDVYVWDLASENRPLEKAQIEKEAREIIRFANKALRAKLSTREDKAQSGSATARDKNGKSTERRRMDWTAHGLKNSQLPVFAGDDFEDWTVTFDAFVGNEVMHDKF